MLTRRSDLLPGRLAAALLVTGAAVAVAACGAATVPKPALLHGSGPAKPTVARSASAAPAPNRARAFLPGSPLPPPATLVPFTPRGPAGQGLWRGAGRRVRGIRAVYETRLVPRGGGAPAGIGWLDTALLSARLYSGSLSPGGGPYRFTAPVEPAVARTLVAAFNGGFKMNDARGGYYTEGRVIAPLRRGAASVVIYKNGTVSIGAWGDALRMTRKVASVRQNLVLLVAHGRPARAAYGKWRAWGATCGATSCAASVPGIEHQWRSGLGVSASGALVYVLGPGLDPLQLAQLLARAGAVRAMQLDINPNWPNFVTYDPGTPGGRAAPSNGRKLLAGTVQGPATFFDPGWARDFITMSVRPAG